MTNTKVSIVDISYRTTSYLASFLHSECQKLPKKKEKFGGGGFIIDFKNFALQKMLACHKM